MCMFMEKGTAWRVCYHLQKYIFEIMFFNPKLHTNLPIWIKYFLCHHAIFYNQVISTWFEIQFQDVVSNLNLYCLSTMLCIVNNFDKGV